MRDFFFENCVLGSWNRTKQDLCKHVEMLPLPEMGLNSGQAAHPFLTGLLAPHKPTHETGARLVARRRPERPLFPDSTRAGRARRAEGECKASCCRAAPEMSTQLVVWAAGRRQGSAFSGPHTASECSNLNRPSRRGA